MIFFIKIIAEKFAESKTMYIFASRLRKTLP